MLFLFIGHKRESGDPVREEHRAEHLRYMSRNSDAVTSAGSFEAPDGTWGGLLLVMDHADPGSAEAWISAEPYNAAGVFGSTHLSPFRQVVPEPEPGLLERELAAQLARDAERGA